MLQIWQGIADGAGVSYDEVRLLNVTLRAPACSTIYAWGDATKDHQLIGGANADGPWLTGNTYGCVLIAYPNDGNAFIDSPLAAGTMSAVRGMNSKGLIVLGSGGQASRPQDRGPGYPGFVAAGVCHPALRHRRAGQGHVLLGLAPWQCQQPQHFADPSGHALVIEQTAAAAAVRTPGQFGEKDYILATNFFETPTMRPANDPNQLQFGDLDDWYRYGTEE